MDTMLPPNASHEWNTSDGTLHFRYTQPLCSEAHWSYILRKAVAMDMAIETTTHRRDGLGPWLRHDRSVYEHERQQYHEQKREMPSKVVPFPGSAMGRKGMVG